MLNPQLRLRWSHLLEYTLPIHRARIHDHQARKLVLAHALLGYEGTAFAAEMCFKVDAALVGYGKVFVGGSGGGGGSEVEVGGGDGKGEGGRAGANFAAGEAVAEGLVWLVS
jgi:hypothetical protein